MNFKFDKEGSDIDLSLGGDNGVEPKTPPAPERKPSQTSSSNQDDARASSAPNNVPLPRRSPMESQRVQPTMPTTVKKIDVPVVNRVPQQRPPVAVPPARQQPVVHTPAQAPIHDYDAERLQQARYDEERAQQVRFEAERAQQQLDVERATQHAREDAERLQQSQYEAERIQRAQFEADRLKRALYEEERHAATEYVDYRSQQAQDYQPQYGDPQRNVNSSQKVEQPVSYPLPQPVQKEEEVKPKKKGLSFFKAKEKDEQPVEKKISALRGGRKNIVYVKIGISAIIVLLCVVGGKSLFFPTQFPSPAQVTQVVRDDLQITKFPVTKANSFVINFTNAYLTYTPELSGSERELRLQQYASDLVLNLMPLRVANSTVDGAAFEQTLVSTPIITGVESIDNNNAVFTVQAQVSTGSTILLSVPVYYDNKTDSLAVSAVASILPATGLAKVPTENHKINWASDDAIVDVFQPDLENYLSAWASSNSDVVKRYLTNDASIAAKTGLKSSVTFVSISDVAVELKDETTATKPHDREATFTVVWADAKSPNVTYNQSYLLEIAQQQDLKWYVKNITSLVTK